jgi:hypothetical protein
MKAADRAEFSSENLVDLYRTTRRHSKEDGTLREPQTQRTAYPLKPNRTV